MKVSSGITYSFLLLLAIALLFFANLLFGSVRIPAPSVWNIMLGHSAEREAWQQIVLESRLPQAVTALFTGGALAVSGLMLQTFFRNPLADPGILGISSGASLGVAVVMLTIGSAFSGFSSFFLPHSLIIVLGAFLGSLLVLGIIIAFSSIVRNNILLLIIGIMVGYLSSSLITLMKFWSTSESVFVYTIWGMGDFSGVSSAQLPFYIIAVSAGLIFSLLLIKPLNALLLGENYAINLGIKVRAVRLMILFCTGLLTAVTTAFCGPISFLGLAVPHMARLILKTSNHKSLLPVTILSGSVMARRKEPSWSRLSGKRISL